MAILAVSRDTGGTNTVLPVSRLLRNEFDIQYLASGRAEVILGEAGEQFETIGDLDQIRQKYPKPQAIVTSMCFSGGGGPGRDLVPLYKGICPIIALQDLWGAQLLTTWKDPIYRPDFICINDQLGADIVLRAWPDFNPSRIEQTGFPALDKYSNYNSDQIALELRKKLAIPANIPIVTFGGQAEGSAETLAELISVLNELDRKVYLIPRSHPNMKSDYPHEVEPWAKALDSFRSGILLRDSSVFKTPEILALSSVIISMYSTMLLEASVLRKQNIAILYPEGKALPEFLHEMQGLMSEPPTVTLGCTSKASCRNELKKTLLEALEDNPRIRQNQEKYIQLDGKNSLRTAEFIKKIIKKPN